ncbi:hypothetical protein FS749_003051 [Ceratobasidium sp. UAMH 11750]|nr:hypothetical protein FS749_003051 [Ceratobasidium sp. UAMH 11750]
MPRCDICHAEHPDLTVHYAADHPRVAYTVARWAQPSHGSSNEFVSDQSGDDQAYCFQCSRQFNSADALNAHLGDAQVHRRTGHASRMIFQPTAADSAGFRGGRESRHNNVGAADQSSSTFSNQGANITNYEHNSRREYDAQAQGYVAQEDELYAQTSSEYESGTTSDEEMGTDTDTDDNAPHDPNVNYTSSSSSAIPRRYLEPTPAEYHHQYEPIARGTGLQGSLYNSSTQHIPSQPDTLLDPRPNGEGSSLHQGRKDVVETYCRRCGVPSRLGASHCEVARALAQSLDPTPTVTRSHGIICPICLELAAGATSTLCGHVFCAPCIQNALRIRQVCPVCKRPIGQYSTHPIYPTF